MHESGGNICTPDDYISTEHDQGSYERCPIGNDRDFMSPLKTYYWEEPGEEVRVRLRLNNKL